MGTSKVIRYQNKLLFWDIFNISARNKIHFMFEAQLFFSFRRHLQEQEDTLKKLMENRQIQQMKELETLFEKYALLYIIFCCNRNNFFNKLLTLKIKLITNI